MAEIVALILAILDVYLGATGQPWLIVLALAVAGVAVYFWMRATSMIRLIQQSGLITALFWSYCAQLITAALLFGFGRLVGMVI